MLTIFNFKKIIFTLLMLLSFNFYGSSFNTWRANRNQHKLINMVSRELDQIEKYYSQVFSLLESDHTDDLCYEIKNQAKKSYWFFSLNRYQDQILSDIRALNIFKNKKNFNDETLAPILIKINQTQDQLQKLNQYMCNKLIQKTDFWSKCDISLSNILNAIVFVGIMIYGVFAAMFFAAMTRTVAEAWITGICTFLIFPALYFISKPKSVDY